MRNDFLDMSDGQLVTLIKRPLKGTRKVDVVIGDRVEPTVRGRRVGNKLVTEEGKECALTFAWLYFKGFRS